MTLAAWADRWGIPAAALEELRTMFIPSTIDGGTSEAATQARLRVVAPSIGAALWRNNNGACKDETGRMIRYGLGNDSKKINDVWKSSDLIGITPLTVRPEHMGRTLGIFTAVEVKRPDWQRPENDRDRAQMAFLTTVFQHGGIATFATHESHYVELIARVRG